MKHTPLRVSVIITHNRPEQLNALLGNLHGQSDVVIVIDNASEPPVSDFDVLSRIDVEWAAIVHDPEQPPNLYRLWNFGFDIARECAAQTDTWDVAMFNDDAVVPPGWFDAVAAALRSGPYAAASSDPYGRIGAHTGGLVKTAPDGDLMTRMCPWAFAVRGELALRADERFGWWWGDTDFDWMCRQSGGVVIVPEYIVHNSLANSTTFGALAEQAGRDRVTFAEKWGHNPW